MVCIDNNRNTKIYLENLSIQYNKPLFISDVDYLSCKITPVIPYKTDIYSNIETHKVKPSYPLCMIQNFPTEKEHIIVWSKEKFNYLIEISNVFNNIRKNEEIETLLKDYNITEISGCMKLAELFFNKYYIDDIEKLLHNYPKDNEIWLNKKYPSIVSYDSNEIEKYIDITSNIIYKNN